LTILLSFQCRKHHDKPEIEKLPPETQTGAQTFGCLINGKTFKPKGPSLSPILSSYYQHTYYPSESGYVFQVAALDNSHGSNKYSVVLLLDSVRLETNKTIVLKKMGHGFSNGTYYVGTTGGLNVYYTNEKTGGSVTFTRFDTVQQIASGTFWFNAVDEKGDTVKITDGRFDVHYTR
jgi:hypothetical protein